ncbi:hypothetical protein BDE27_2305 [Xenorhabdus ehlersii]|uniref:Histidine decarboxylase n=1 Tax=Xenorhabdus ehlersii TaxID=290111 RepID=A0A2D0IY60_9GAMM|nr:histidine decarboxylase [Xenorhabdus ehlersii]PHM26887.1 histidine decarboxylase [Xenorhabdus ehlersii]RKE90440.1 hypothetical protein BDE27_2305 [Xenorhabdus ehlersii]
MQAACWVGRELFPEGTLCYSKYTHYSVAKIAKLLRIKSCLVESLPIISILSVSPGKNDNFLHYLRDCCCKTEKR